MDFPDDQKRLVIGLLLSLPISYLIPHLPSLKIRHLYSFIIGIALQYYVYGIEIFLTFIQHLIVYFLISLVGRKCGAIITAYTVISLFGYHIYRMIVDYGGWTLDISTIMMTLVCRYSLFAYAYQDGGSSDDALNDDQKQNKIQKLPNFMQYLSYCQFAPTAVLGTAFEFNHFRSYMGMEANSQYEKPKIDWMQILRVLGEAIIYVIIYFVVSVKLLNISYMKNPDFIQKRFYYICIYSFFSISFVKFKYYFGWKLCMAILHISNFTYNSKTKCHDKIEIVDVYKVQTTLHLTQKIANWNMSVQKWLQKCIYKRLPFKNKMYNQLITFVVSAFWHGTYFGYYLSFVIWFLQLHLSGLVYKYSLNEESRLVKFYKKTGIFGYSVLWIFSNLLFTHNCIYFMVLDSRSCIRVLKALYFSFPIVIILLILFFTFIKPPKTIKKEIKPKDT